MTRPISPAGFLLGALLAATAAAVKILFLDEIQDRRAARAAETRPGKALP